MKLTSVACQACGYRGGDLAPTRSGGMDDITDRLVRARLPSMLACSGSLASVDGADACLRRMMARR